MLQEVACNGHIPSKFSLIVKIFIVPLYFNFKKLAKVINTTTMYTKASYTLNEVNKMKTEH